MNSSVYLHTHTLASSSSIGFGSWHKYNNNNWTTKKQQSNVNLLFINLKAFTIH